LPPDVFVCMTMCSLDMCAYFAGGFFEHVRLPQIILLFFTAAGLGEKLAVKEPRDPPPAWAVGTGFFVVYSLLAWGGFF